MKIVVLALLAYLSSPLFAVEDPNAHAARIARAQPRIGANLRELRLEAERIRNRKLREMALQILKAPKFTFVTTRRAQEKAIAQALQEAHLWEPKDGTAVSGGFLFPTQDPMPFAASAGGPWTGHHAYPGGLVYHTLFNLKMGLAYAANYHAVYGVRPDLDSIRFATLWHDSAKTWTLPWNENGSNPAHEQTIAGTSAHHIFGIAEALYRSVPPSLVVVIASAHENPAPGKTRESLVSFLKAGAIIAGVPNSAAGLKGDGSDLAEVASIEAFIHHFDDGDYPLSGESCRSVGKAIDTKQGTTDYWARDEQLAANGDIALYPPK